MAVATKISVYDHFKRYIRPPQVIASTGQELSNDIAGRDSKDTSSDLLR